MDVHVRVGVDENGPVVVKSASGRAAGRLRHEHQRLTRAVHPGVVALVHDQPEQAQTDPRSPRDRAAPSGDAPGGTDTRDPADDADAYVLHIRYAGEPVSRWTGTVSDIAGLGAAVAGTLADLHGLGIVHGRINGSHILIGDDSRPRLCGLAHPGDASAADDVAALGAVLGELLERAPAGRRRRRRGSAGAARALRQVVERATDPVPTRRPSAGAFADAILAAVPGAALPAPSRSGGPTGAGDTRGDQRQRPHDDAARAATSGLAPAAQQDTLDRIWSYAGEQSDDERWAAAFGSGPRDLPVGGAPSSAPTGASVPPRPTPGLLDDPSPPPLPTARVDTPGWRTTGAAEPSAADDGDLTSSGSDRNPWTGDERDPTSSGSDRNPWTGDERDLTSSGSDRDPWAGDDADDHLTRDHHVPAPRVIRPRPVDDDTRPGRGRQLAVVAALATATCLALAAGVMASARGGGPGGRAAGPEPDSAAPAACPPAAAPVADVDGDGCAEGLVVDGSTVDAGVARWTLGEPGDLVALGDWDCDGEASAALLRPTTGDVFVFAAWAPADEPVTVTASQQVDGGVGIRARPTDDSGCDQLLVDRADGTAATVEVPR